MTNATLPKPVKVNANVANAFALKKYVMEGGWEIREANHGGDKWFIRSPKGKIVQEHQGVTKRFASPEAAAEFMSNYSPMQLSLLLW